MFARKWDKNSKILFNYLEASNNILLGHKRTSHTKERLYKYNVQGCSEAFIHTDKRKRHFERDHK